MRQQMTSIYLQVYFACHTNSAMKSTLKTTAAVLRSLTGKTTDAEWADILGKSVHTIRHLEAGSLPLSAAMAAKMNYESGISIKWLMDGDPTAPPVTSDGRPFTKEIYDEVQAGKKSFATVKDDDLRNTLLDVLCANYAILVNANGKRNFHLAVYQTAKDLAERREKFGKAKDASPETVLAYMGLKMTDRPFLRPPKHLPEVEDLSRLPDKQPTSKTKSKRPSKKRRRQG